MKLTKIPKNIFQTWSTKDTSLGFKLLTQSWLNLNPGYSYYFFDDNDCIEFIKNNFEKNVYDAYCRIIPGAFKADFWRYCVLYVYGGVYVDMDTICINQIDDFLNEYIEFMTPVDLNNRADYGKYNLFNCFIASVPKHPILLECIHKIVYHVENNIVPFSNLDFSGPGVLGKATNKYLGLPEESGFLGKEGIIKHVKLLKFEQGAEYVVDSFNQKRLFQNKNGSSVIKYIYTSEMGRVKHIDWGTCANPIKPKSTASIVTMFYKIREKENNQSNSHLNHSVERYLNIAKEFILKLEYNLILFTDSPDIIEFVSNERKDNIRIYNLPFEETYFYRHLDRLHELQGKFTIFNGNVEHETPMYIILNNNKFDFVERAIELNPFKSSHFVWMDFGINHVAKNTERIHDWMPCIPDKIKQLCINPYIERVEDKKMFQNIFHHMAGGLFSGSKENLLKYSELFKKKTEQIYSEEWYQVDEAVMTIVARENPDLFDLFYGDYQGIISNYLYPMHNIDLIFTGIKKCMDNNNTRKAWEMLNYCTAYFNENIHDRYAYQYITNKLVTDYYNNNRHLTKELIAIVKKLQAANDEGVKSILINNANNIEYYENKAELL